MSQILLFNKEVSKLNYQGVDLEITWSRLSGTDQLRIESQLKSINRLEDEDEKQLSIINFYLDYMSQVIYDIRGISDLPEGKWPSSPKERRDLLDQAGLGFLVFLFTSYQERTKINEVAEKK